MGPTTVSLVLRSDLASVRRARAFVEQECQRLRIDDDRCHDAALMVSELVTNAIVHGRSDARLCIIAATDHVLRIEVSDGDSRHPEPVSQDDAALDGRGLVIVDALSTDWGVRDEVLGKTVWFEV